MCRKMTHLVSFVLASAMLGSICRSMENYSPLQEEVVVVPNIAYNPFPVDEAKFVDPNVTLSWTAGFAAIAHTVYIGDSFDDANNASGGLSQETASYHPGTLEFEKTYYWRVDEYVTTLPKKVMSGASQQNPMTLILPTIPGR